MKRTVIFGLFGLLLLHALAFRLWGQQVRWIISPVVTVTEQAGEVTNYRAPKVSILIDPSTGKGYQHSSAIATANWAVSLVYSADFSGLDLDAEVVNLLERDYLYSEDLLNKTPAELGFNAAKVNRIRQRLEARGVDIGKIFVCRMSGC